MPVGDELRLSESDLLAMIGYEKANNELLNRRLLAAHQEIARLAGELESHKEAEKVTKTK